MQVYFVNHKKQCQNLSVGKNYKYAQTAEIKTNDKFRNEKICLISDALPFAMLINLNHN